MSFITLKVQEGNEPLLTITAQKRNPDGTVSPYDLTGATVTMYVKATKDTPDGSPMATYTATITDAVNGKFTIQLSTAATANPGTFWYKINAVSATHPQTLQHGDFIVENV
jgi:BppU N-terminal domain